VRPMQCRPGMVPIAALLAADRDHGMVVGEPLSVGSKGLPVARFLASRRRRLWARLRGAPLDAEARCAPCSSRL
jgi:hypothetical protein